MRLNTGDFHLGVIVIIAMFMSKASLIYADDAKAPGTAPTSAYERGLTLLAAGKQGEAEKLVEGRMESNAAGDSGKNAAEEVFFVAVCRRSRFEIQKAFPLFRYVEAALHDSPHGRAARLMVELDGKLPDAEDRFLELDNLSVQHPDDPMLLWMVAVQCRSLKKPAIGAERYKKLCEIWKPGPVLVHQTYANLLHDLGRYDEALEHRYLAVKLEPKSWSYAALGNTLTAMHRWKEADDAFVEATNRVADEPLYWRNWAYSMQLRGDKVGTKKMLDKADEAAKAKKEK